MTMDLYSIPVPLSEEQLAVRVCAFVSLHQVPDECAMHHARQWRQQDFMRVKAGPVELESYLHDAFLLPTPSSAAHPAAHLVEHNWSTAQHPTDAWLTRLQAALPDDVRQALAIEPLHRAPLLCTYEGAIPPPSLVGLLPLQLDEEIHEQSCDDGMMLGEDLALYLHHRLKTIPDQRKFPRAARSYRFHAASMQHAYTRATLALADGVRAADVALFARSLQADPAVFVFVHLGQQQINTLLVPVGRLAHDARSWLMRAPY
jgi:hypothetical protein